MPHLLIYLPIYSSLIPYISPHIILYKYPRSLSLTILFLLQTSFKTTHREITTPLVKFNNTSDPGFANFSWNSPPPNIQGTQTPCPPNTENKLEQQSYTKPLLQPSSQEFEVVYLGFNFGSTPSTPTHQCIQKSTACLAQTMKKHFHFRNKPFDSKRFSYFKPCHLDSPELNSTKLL